MAELPDVSGVGDREQRSSREVFNVIFELRSYPLSMQSTYTIQWTSKVTGKRRRHNGRHSKGTTDDKRMSKTNGTGGNDKRSTDQYDDITDQSLNYIRNKGR